LLLYARGNIKRWAPAEIRTFQAPDGTRLDLAPGDLTAKSKGAQPGYRPFDVTVEALKHLHSIAWANGTNVLIILQPSKEEVYLPLLGEPAPDPARALRETLGELGIPYLDLLPDFRRRADKGEVLFFEVDGHPNARGYALIAELVLIHLIENAKRYGLKDLLRSASL